ncbi:hypothetical protein [Prevotella sp. HUN102]|uniref:hypothetical protein n=1 Tax=Prevotella sp. HUN102 TaxID=1392486 RepID=UPI0004905B85|nr:hypothetical protein [Prevotella sp. HUN102]
MDIIQRNFFNILRSGAFNDKTRLELMSAFKWYKLFQMVDIQNVLNIFVKGINNNSNDENLTLPQDLVEKVQKTLEERKPEQKIEKGEIRLSNGIFNNKLQKIIHKELHSIDTSVEAVDILKIIVFNTNAMLNKGISLEGIIRLGQYLRTRGDKVDFVKLENWISNLHLDRMAQLQGSILMEFFGFEQDELPFVKQVEKGTYKLVIRTISNLVKETTVEWHFKENSAGFVRNNGTVLRRNLRRSLRYFDYAPLETTSNFIHNFRRSLAEIEE